MREGENCFEGGCYSESESAIVGTTLNMNMSVGFLS